MKANSISSAELELLRGYDTPTVCNVIELFHLWVGGVVIIPGDLLHGDANGVTTVPLEIASEVAHACAEYMAAEQIVLDYCKSAQATAAGFVEARVECGRRLAALSERVRLRSR